FFAGWALLATYSCFIAANIAEVGLFGGNFLDSTGIWHSPEWIVISLVAVIAAWLLAYGDVKVATRALLSFEGISVTLILILLLIIFWKVIGGAAPSGQSFRLQPVVPASGIPVRAAPVASACGLLPFSALLSP